MLRFVNSEEFLLTLGAPPDRIGFDQLAAVIEYVMAHPEARSITRDVYPAIAAQFSTTTLCLEHNLRTVIEHIWRCGNQRLLDEMFVARGAYRPGNKAFVFTLARRLQLARQRQRRGTESAAAAPRGCNTAQPYGSGN